MTLSVRMSQAAGHGIRIATVWQSLAQMQERYRLGMHTILADSSAKIVMGSTSDEITRWYVEGLVRQEDEDIATGRRLDGATGRSDR